MEGWYGDQVLCWVGGSVGGRVVWGPGFVVGGWVGGRVVWGQGFVVGGWKGGMGTGFCSGWKGGTGTGFCSGWVDERVVWRQGFASSSASPKPLMSSAKWRLVIALPPMLTVPL